MRKWLLAIAGVLTILIVGTATIIGLSPRPPEPTMTTKVTIESKAPSVRAMMEDRLRHELRPHHLECNSIVRLEIELVDCLTFDEGIATFVLTQFDLREYDRALSADYVHAQRHLVISYALAGPQVRRMTTCVEEQECVTDDGVSADEYALITQLAKQKWQGEIELWR